MEGFAIHTISRAGQNVSVDFRKKLKIISKKVLTKPGESVILCKLSDTDGRWNGALKKVTKKVKKGLDKWKRMW